MRLSRREFLSSALAAGFAAPAFADEPFKVNLKEAKQLEYKFQMRDMAFATNEPVGTIVVDAVHRFLYHVKEGGMATRYGVAVGKGAHAWTGEAIIKKMAEWPTWTPAPYHLQVKPELIKWKNGMPGGPDNPLGARAMYLFKGNVDTINRIHGSAKVNDIGKKATAGCIGMLNVDIIHLYANVQVGTRVVMLG
jgi:lipoprotein-anchoring transpeptidase ErfK/SrfK